MVQFRGMEIIKLEKFKPAKVEDIARVHEGAYVSGLEKVYYTDTIHICNHELP